MESEPDRYEEVLTAIRRIMRAVDLHSRAQIKWHGLTSPQLLVLKALARRGEMSTGALAREISLSHATVTGIVDRLVKRALVQRSRSPHDKRLVMVSCAEAGHQVLSLAPPLLQERFIREFDKLQDWERTWILAALQRLVALMEARDLDAAPILESGAMLEPDWAETREAAEVHPFEAEGLVGPETFNEQTGDDEDSG